ncbi:MAG: thioredoxin-disulfide reductase [Clostridiaceae bacterium]|nr:thioredoxin-disulfide reductase [Clostridiaceae bacterium]MBW4859025.1 thioredoxin-disulfide reductase [Clostridiaceae bacterium]MBW4869600.1 thioredoxin-disulfide reductase [Clostridiaceae bacterium]
MTEIYDVIIIGAGPAGLSAGLYASRSRLKTLIIEKEKSGGQIVTTNEVENYPGSIENSSGPSLTARMVQQADEFGAKRIIDTVLEVNLDDKIKTIKGEKNEYKAKTVIIATGAVPRPIGIPGEKELTGKGVSYCATCDGAFFTDLEVYVVGGGDAAVEEAIFLTKFARKVTIIHRRDELRAVKSIQEKAFKNEKIDFMWDSVVKEIKGDGLVNSMVVENTKSGEQTEVVADEDDGMFGIFVFIGYLPATDIFEGKVEMENGYIPTDADMRTNIDGVFAAGDCRVKTVRQVVTATGDGAIAAIQAEKYISEVFDD